MKTKNVLLILVLLGLGLGLAAKLVVREIEQKKLQGPPAPKSTELEVLIQMEPDLRENETTKEHERVAAPGMGSVPKALNIEMPFFTQAPHSNWDYPWQEACEEASIALVANLYYEMNHNADSFNEELLKLVEWEMETYGAYEHTSVEQTQQMIKENYQLDSMIHQDPSFKDIQQILNRGNLIVAPFAGKLLKNPNFKNGGPPYHMSVIKGYDSEKMQIVTHDVGTRNGANYVYSWETIAAALHDWHDEDILLGEALILEVLHP